MNIKEAQAIGIVELQLYQSGEMKWWKGTKGSYLSSHDMSVEASS